jgi:Hint domain
LAETASATITAIQLAPAEWQYSVTLHDTGSTTVGTFWFAWVPGQDFLDTRPSSVTDPAGWQDLITHGGSNDGYAIQWTVSPGSPDLQSGDALSGFSFTSSDAPSAVFGDSDFHSGTPVLTSFVYAGAPETDPGFKFEVAACFRAGTRILTERGEVAVEDLRLGDRVPTLLADAAAPITWIGHRTVDCTHHPKPREVWPVRVAAGAFGPGRPHSEMFLSPNHAVYLNEVLIPIRLLANGSTIAQVPQDHVTYYHIKLPQHDVVLTQGLPTESFLDVKDGCGYANAPLPIQLHSDLLARIWEAFGCTRLVVTGPELAAARAEVARLAAHRAAA